MDEKNEHEGGGLGAVEHEKFVKGGGGGDDIYVLTWVCSGGSRHPYEVGRKYPVRV